MTENPPFCELSTKVGGPVPSAWREGTLTRAMEIEALLAWTGRLRDAEASELCRAVGVHLEAARDAANCPRRGVLRMRSGPPMERAISNLDAAEADLLQVAPGEYLLGQLPCLLNMTRRHLAPDDPRLLDLERIVAAVDAIRPDPDAVVAGIEAADLAERRLAIIETERRRIVSVVRGAGSAALREQLRLRSFRNVLIGAAVLMMLLAIGIGLLGLLNPASFPLCFAPQTKSETIVVCPTGSSPSLPTPDDIDPVIRATATGGDILLVELVGFAAAAVAAVAAIRKLRGSSEPHGLPVTLAALKLPTGAVTAVLGLLLLRGQFFPGLTALDTPGQIVAWALVFGYAQQLFTRLVDQQAHVVLDNVRGAAKPAQP